jgi:hypothetical protein
VSQDTKAAFLPLWPDVGRDICGLSRSSAYAAARKKEIPTVRFGKSIRVPLAWVRQARWVHCRASCRRRWGRQPAAVLRCNREQTPES